MKEIGGYFEFEQLIDNAYYKNLISLNTASNALCYLIKAKRIKKIYIPYYLCDSISEVCQREGCSFEYYSINLDFTPDFGKELKDNEFLYIVNYYGQISNQMILEYKDLYKQIIVDNVQAFFQKPLLGVDTIYSCRKFFGVPDGAYLSTDCFLNENLNTDISFNRLNHIFGRYEFGVASDYYNKYKNNEIAFSNLQLAYMSKITKNILGAIDYDAIITRREENFKQLHKYLRECNMLQVKCPIGPFAYPFYVENGSKVREALINKKIFIPILWPNVVKSIECVADKYANNILPLPCDQRYDCDDMMTIIKEIKNVLFT